MDNKIEEDIPENKENLPFNNKNDLNHDLIEFKNVYLRYEKDNKDKIDLE